MRMRREGELKKGGVGNCCNYVRNASVVRYIPQSRFSPHRLNVGNVCVKLIT